MYLDSIKRKKIFIILIFLLLLFSVTYVFNCNKYLYKYVLEDTEQSLDNLKRNLSDNRVRITSIKYANKITKEDVDFLYNRQYDIDREILDMKSKYDYIDKWKKEEAEAITEYYDSIWHQTKKTFSIYDDFEIRFKNNETSFIELEDSDIENLNYIFNFYKEFGKKVLEFKNKLI